MTIGLKESAREPADRKRLEAILGSENVADDSDTLDQYFRDMSFMPGRLPHYVVRPMGADQVQALVQWANRTLMPLIPVSSGPPHFRGDTIPDQGGVIVDMSGMKKIMRVDRRNRVAMIEPGVTFAELKVEVEKQGMKVMTPLAPRSTKSVIGSCLEREPILSPRYHWDMSDPLCCAEVVFGTGDLFRTGAAAGPGTLEEQWKSGQAQKSPLGPGQSDLFRVVQGAQGTLGILTWATVRLELLPSIQKIFLVGCERVDEIIDFVYRILRLKMGDECLVIDRLNLASILETEAEEIEKLVSRLPPYLLVFVIAGFDRFPEERVDYQRKDIMDIAENSGINVLDSLPGVDSARLLEAISGPCKDPYWKLRLKGNSADIFFLTTLDRAQAFTDAMGRAAEDCGFPKSRIGTYIQPIQQGRACHLEFSLFFDPADETDALLAKDASEKVGRTMMREGAFFSRPYGKWPEMICDRHAENVIALRKVKRIFDPNGVMNPGRLFF